MMKRFTVGALTATLCLSLLDAPASGQSSNGYKRVSDALSKRLEDGASAGTNAGTNQATEQRQEPAPRGKRRRAKRGRKRG
jgi:hypothetical protein